MKMAVTKCVVCLQLISCLAQIAARAWTNPPTTPTTGFPRTVSTTTVAPNGPLSMDAKPDTIIPGLTEAFSVNCSLEDASSYGHPMDIILFQTGILGSSQTRQKIASVSTFDPLEVLFHTPTTASGSCHFQDGRHDLILHWDKPKLEQAGDYECEVTIMNSDVDYSTFVTQSKITYRTASLSDMVDHMQDELTAIKNQLDVRNEVLLMLTSSEVMHGHRYHLSTLPFLNIDRAEKVCQMVGGHVAVFEDATELSDAVSFMSSMGYSSTPQFMVGLYQESHRSSWTNKATGDTVSFYKWRSSSSYHTTQCAYLYSYISTSNWYYDLAKCNDPTSTMLFLCKSDVIDTE